MARFTFGNKGSDSAECETFEVVWAKSSNHTGEMVPKDSNHLLESRDYEGDSLPESNQVIISKPSSAFITRQRREGRELLDSRVMVDHSHGSNIFIWCHKMFHPSQGLREAVTHLLALGESMRRRPNGTSGRTSVGEEEVMFGVLPTGDTTSMRQFIPSPVPLAVRKGVKKPTPRTRHLMLNQVQLTPSTRRTNAYHIGSLGELSVFLTDNATHVSFSCAGSLDLRSNPFEEGGDDASMARTWSLEQDKELGAKARSKEQHGTKLKEAARTKEEEANCRELIKFFYILQEQGISQPIQANAEGTVQDTLGLTRHWTYGPATLAKG